MPSPIGNWTSPDEGDDPDLWPEWYDDEDDSSGPARSRTSPWVVVVAVVLLAVLLLGLFL